MASARPMRLACWPMSATSTASPTGTGPRPGTAPHPGRLLPATSSDTVCPAPATGASTALHIMAIAPLRRATDGRVYYDRRKAGGMPSMMAIRALKCRLSNVVYARILDDQLRREATSPAGQSGNGSVSSAADSHPSIDSSDKPHPGPATSKPRTTGPALGPDRRGRGHGRGGRAVQLGERPHAGRVLRPGFVVLPGPRDLRWS